VSGGAVLTLAMLACLSTGTVGASQGMIVFEPSESGPPAVSAEEAPQPLTVARREVSHRGGILTWRKGVIFAAVTRPTLWNQTRAGAVQSVGTGERRTWSKGGCTSYDALRAPGLCARGGLMACR